MITDEVMANLLGAARAHRDRCINRYGANSYQARSAERAVETITRGMIR